MVRRGNPLASTAYDDVLGHARPRSASWPAPSSAATPATLGIPDERIVVFPDAPSALAGVEAGRVDAYAGTEPDGPATCWRKADDPDARERADPFAQPVIDGEPVRGCGAFGFRPDDDAFRAGVRPPARRAPRHARSTWTWSHRFGFGETELPGDVTAAELCAGGATPSSVSCRPRSSWR